MVDHISPISDLGFKKTLASEENKDILAGLIKDFFKVTAEEIAIENPYSIAICKEYIESIENAESVDNKKEITKLRQTFKDVAASFRVADFVTEVQIAKTYYFDERAIYYPLDRYCKNYGKYGAMETDADGKPYLYSSLRPVYSLNVLGYTHYDDADALRIFELYDPKRRKRYGKDLLRIGFFELSKDKVETKNQRHWQTYFKTGEAGADAPEYIKKAAQVIKYVNLSEEERRIVDAMSRYEANEQSDRRYIISESRKEGRIEGEKIGITKGRAEGITKGRAEEQKKALAEKRESIIRLIEMGLPDEQISDAMRTDIAEVRKLRKPGPSKK